MTGDEVAGAIWIFDLDIFAKLRTPIFWHVRPWDNANDRHHAVISARQHLSKVCNSTTNHRRDAGAQAGGDEPNVLHLGDGAVHDCFDLGFQVDCAVEICARNRDDKQWWLHAHVLDKHLCQRYALLGRRKPDRVKEQVWGLADGPGVVYHAKDLVIMALLPGPAGKHFHHGQRGGASTELRQCYRSDFDLFCTLPIHLEAQSFQRHTSTRIVVVCLVLTAELCAIWVDYGTGFAAFNLALHHRRFLGASSFDAALSSFFRFRFLLLYLLTCLFCQCINLYSMKYKKGCERKRRKGAGGRGGRGGAVERRSQSSAWH